MRYEEFIKIVMDDFTKKSLIEPAEFPNLELYSDQVISFFNDKLRVYAEDEEDEVIRKTMISNYVKHNMLPSPIKKKYSRDHMILIAMIFHLKSTFQMTEIESLMKPFVENYDSQFDDKIDILKLYETMYPNMERSREKVNEDIQEDIENIKESIWEDGLDDDDASELFMLILSISMKVGALKFAAHNLIEEYYSKDKNGGKSGTKT